MASADLAQAWLPVPIGTEFAICCAIEVHMGEDAAARPNDAPIRQVLAANLTATQCAAAEDPANEVLALACAGSGKSRTLAFRIARLVGAGEPAPSIVAFTFTEKAAESIKRRVAHALAAAGLEPGVLGAMYIGTIHAYCKLVLGEMDARYRQFDILDDNRLKLYLISRYPALGLNIIRAARNARYFETVNEVANAWKIVNDEMISLVDVAGQDPLLGGLLQRFSDRLQADHFVDFSLMVRRVAEALRLAEPGAVRAVAGLRHLMVDEYQDVNPAQELLIRELHRRSRTLFVVGDDDQAVYAWRGADVSNILTFRDRYPECSSHTLAQNFRSTPAIVAAADAFAAQELGAMRLAKNPRADEPPGPRDFRRLFFQTRDEEAAWVADRIAALRGQAYRESDGTVRGLTPGDFAILMRSTRFPDPNGAPPRHTPFTQALAARGILFTLEAGGGVFDRPQVACLRSTFELLRNASPTREETQAHFEAVVLPAFAQARFEPVARVLSDWGRRIHRPLGGGAPRQRLYPQRLVHELLNAFDIARSDFDDATMQDIGIFSRMLQDVEAVYLSVDSAARFQEILNFLQNTAESGYDTTTDAFVQRPDAVMVSTVHQVKGLEFPVVFVVDVEANRFPGRRHGYSGWLPAAIIQPALARGAYQSTPQEEARLFYTAITRPERFLYVTGAQVLPGARRRAAVSPYATRLAHPELSTEPAGLPAGLVPARPIPRTSEAVLPTSYSEVRYYLRCPKDYQLRKRFGFSPAIPELFGFGMTVHTSVGKLHEVFRDRIPTGPEAENIAREVFHLKHVPPSADPVNRPGAYERARDSAVRITRTYAEAFGQDFVQERQVEARFEIPVEGAVISGAIDLLLRVDAAGHILDATVIDFKAIEGGDAPEQNPEIEWTALSLQVQLYAKAAREILGENTRTGAVHLLKDNQRIDVPVDDAAVDAAVRNVEWAVRRILAADFPMRPHPEKCAACDFRALCAQTTGEFSSPELPPPISTPAGPVMALSFSQLEPAGAQPQP